MHLMQFLLSFEQWIGFWYVCAIAFIIYKCISSCADPESFVRGGPNLMRFLGS